MKRLSFFGLLLMFSVLISCNDKAAGDSAAGNDKHKEMLESNRAVLKAIETGDSATIHKYISDDAIDHGGGPNGADAKGPEIITMLSDIHNSIDNLKFEVIQEAANDDYLFCLARMTGTVKKPVWGMPAGTQADTKSVDMIKVKDGKMVEHWSFMDPAEMMKMMPPGAMPAGGAMSKDSAK